MKTRTIKLILTVAVLALVICASLATVAMANEPAPEIISQNIAYQGDFALMYAVDAETATGPVELYLYYDYPAEGSVAAKKYVAEEAEDITVAGETVSAFVFTTEGVSAKDMADVFYVQAIDADGDKSAVRRYSVGEYFYERLATPGITAEQDNFYRQGLAFGAAAQAVLAKGSTPITDYRLVKVNGGTLEDGFTSGIFPVGTEITPVGEGVNSWTVTSYSDAGEATESAIANGKSFTLSGITVVTSSDEVLAGDGVLTFEDGVVPEQIGKNISSAGGSVSVESVDKNGDTTNALKFTTASGGQDTLTLKPTITEEGYNTVAFEFDLNPGNSGGYELFVRDTAGTQIFKFGFEYSSGNFNFKDLSNTSAGYNFWSVNIPADEWAKIRIEITPDPITKQDVLSISYNGTPITMGVSDGKYHTVGEIFYAADAIAQLDFRSWSSTANTFYFDNVLVERYNSGKIYPLGTNDLENGSYPSNISQKVSEVTRDTVYGSESKVLHLKPDSDGSADTYNIYTNSSIVDKAVAGGFGFAADMKFHRADGGDNPAYDFMWDGYLDGATSTSAVYWLRFVASDGKVYIQNQKNTSEKFEIGVLDEYFYFQAAYTTLENGAQVIHILVNGAYVGTFTTQQNAGACPIGSINNLRIRTMSNYTSDVYLDNIFVGYCYVDLEV